MNNGYWSVWVSNHSFASLITHDDDDDYDDYDCDDGHKIRASTTTRASTIAVCVAVAAVVSVVAIHSGG